MFVLNLIISLFFQSLVIKIIDFLASEIREVEQSFAIREATSTNDSYTH